MNKLEEFKTFIKNNPFLLDRVQTSEVSWQQLYETYDIYGESHPLFSKKKVNNSSNVKSNTQNNDYVKSAISLFKNIDMDKLSENLQSIKKVIGAISEITSVNETSKNDNVPNFSKKNTYRRYND